MWIESTHLSTVRRRIVSPPGYQSPALGDSVPVPGSQEAQRVTLQPRVTTSKLSRVPRLFASAISTSRTRREADNGNRISQWWGHRGLHQDEVLECPITEETRQVSSNYVPCQLTTNSLPSTSPKPFRSRTDGTPLCSHTKPSLARVPAAFEGDDIGNDPSESPIARFLAAFEDYKPEDDSSSVATLVALSRPVSRTTDSCQSTKARSTPSARSSLPHHERYAQHLYSILDYSVKEEPPPSGTSSLGRRTLTPGNIQPCVYPDGQISLFKQGACQQIIHSSPLMSSVTPSTGDDAHRNKTRNTNNSASRELVTPLTSKKKGKGVSVSEEPDPEAISPTNDNPMSASGPILTGPHLPDKANPGEVPSYPAALPSARRTPAANRSASAQPSSSKATSVPHAASKSANSSNKVPRKPSSSGVNRPAASSQQSLNEQNDSTQALREDTCSGYFDISYTLVAHQPDASDTLTKVAAS